MRTCPDLCDGFHGSVRRGPSRQLCARAHEAGLKTPRGRQRPRARATRPQGECPQRRCSPMSLAESPLPLEVLCALLRGAFRADCGVSDVEMCSGPGASVPAWAGLRLGTRGAAMPPPGLPHAASCFSGPVRSRWWNCEVSAPGPAWGVGRPCSGAATPTKAHLPGGQVGQRAGMKVSGVRLGAGRPRQAVQECGVPVGLCIC